MPVNVAVVLLWRTRAEGKQRHRCLWSLLLSDLWVTLGSSFCLSLVWCLCPSLCLFPREDCVWQHCMMVSVLKVGCFLSLKIGLVPLHSIWMSLNFTFFHNFKLILDSWMLGWFVNSCPGFLRKSVLPAVLVMLTAFCTMECEMGANLQKPEIRCSNKNCLVLLDLKEIHREPTCNYFF